MRQQKPPLNPMATMKTSILMDLPSVILIEGLLSNTPFGIVDQEYSTSTRFTFCRFKNLKVEGTMNISVEKQRANVFDNGMQPEIIMEGLRSNLKINGVGLKEAKGAMATPGNSGDDIRSIPSSGSGHGFFSHNSDGNSGRSGKKRPFSASKNSENGLEPVAEEFSWQHPDPNFKLARLSEHGLTSDLMVDTGPTQTQKPPIINQPHDHMTDSIRMHLKTHFDTPGTAKTESLNHLAFGMNRKRASCLFYQTCVLAASDHIRVEQKEPYGDILISRGAKM